MQQPPEEKNQKRASHFIDQLYKAIQDQEHVAFKSISWSLQPQNSRISFIILDSIKFSHELLPSLSRNSNLASFVRQLNMYSFKKISSRRRDNTMAYFHPSFKQGNPELLKQIIRKNPRLMMLKKNTMSQQHHPLSHQKSCTHSAEMDSLSSPKHYDNDSNPLTLPSTVQKKQKKPTYQEGDESDIDRDSYKNYVKVNLESLSFTSFTSLKSQEELNSSPTNSNSYIFRGEDFLSCQRLIEDLQLFDPYTAWTVFNERN